ncbi:MAG: phosphonate ABC transporter, permease protein PhnE [Sulfitobacter sp.]|jgi:phosphonate transport system permease protein|uniref:Phosphonate ABC transporter permease protein n=8 Tax=root TaxID=1 RepID=A0A921TG44_9RHOB|nr:MULTISPECIES: phosphonate ABC transporter, permease protein PhnE [Rhodobacterales]MAN98990.1 phosphonate ABC transporter, permease protein PhnE [Roseovarius sp.]MBP53044.1 phosphonate ABC transporter, permease protein PhnE [Marinobacter sp.]TNE62583.1 MAG: phosphonate ABC transporter, permease protein PhnE [Sphingomonadales bacterium]HDZ80060.1 phosphonate ABC transporter, permease protein PhnE [Roseobacter sp.]ASM75526.1 phosphate-import permease protein PhnE [Pseudosulfitobacter pseudonit|tara:strand:- start:531 stop:1355 length:825 start_codon:yes stop_codon:yes gene_type:complete
MTRLLTAQPALTNAEDVLAEDSKGRRKLLLQIAVVAAIVIVSLWMTGMLDRSRLTSGLPAIGILGTEMFPPDFGRWRDWVGPLVETLAMSIAGTALAVALSLPLGFLAARNTSPNKVIYQVSRVVLNTLRSIPELIMGIIFVAAVGFGMLPGVLALGLHSVGMVGKFFAEAIEHAHPAPIEATEASGATSMQVILHGVLPQVFPQFADVSMYRWEYNFRASTVMGMVGAGGIGTELVGSLRLLDYPQVSAVLLVILACVTVVDILSNMLRAKFR